tara:strand:+ start:2638 stop:2895 length:258 start_codon:yes stop_codon:yes gene_type:complete
LEEKKLPRIFYNYRYDADYLKNNIDNKKIKFEKFKHNFEDIVKTSHIILIYKNNTRIGIIYYDNLKTQYYKIFFFLDPSLLFLVS